MGAAAADLGWPRGLRGHGELSSEVPEVGRARAPWAGTLGAGLGWKPTTPQGRDLGRAACATEHLREGDSGCGFPQPGGGPGRGPGAV